MIEFSNAGQVFSHLNRCVLDCLPAFPQWACPVEHLRGWSSVGFQVYLCVCGRWECLTMRVLWEDMSTVRDLQERWFWQLSTKTAEKSSKILKTAEIGNIIPTFSDCGEMILTNTAEKSLKSLKTAEMRNIIPTLPLICQNHLSCKSRTVDMSSLNTFETNPRTEKPILGRKLKISCFSFNKWTKCDIIKNEAPFQLSRVLACLFRCQEWLFSVSNRCRQQCWMNLHFPVHSCKKCVFIEDIKSRRSFPNADLFQTCLDTCIWPRVCRE